MVGKLNERAIKVITLAEGEARRLGHNFVGTEQILLGIIGEGAGITAEVLKSTGINLKNARVEVEKIIGRGSGFVGVQIPFTLGASRVLEFSQEVARQLGHSYIGSEHLFLGLLHEGEGVGTQVLVNLGANINNIGNQVRRMVRENNEVNYNVGGSNSNNMSFLEAYGTNYAKIYEGILGNFGANTNISNNMPFLGDYGTDYTKLYQDMILGSLGANTSNSNNMPFLGDYGTNYTKLYQDMILGSLSANTSNSNKMSFLEEYGTNYTKIYEEILGNLGANTSNSNNMPFLGEYDSTKLYEEMLGNFGANTINSNKMPFLEEYGTNLTKLAAEGKLDPVVGREPQIERVIQILGRRTKNNPCLIGEAGVGKTAIAEGLAQRIVSGDVPETIEGKKIITLDMGRLLAGTKYRGEFEEKLKNLMDEVKKSDDIILFIDEVHTLIEAGATEGGGAMDAANILKPALARGELKCIGATTLDEYKKHIEKDPALERRFQTVKVPEPSVDDTIQILKGLKKRYEIHHKILYTDEALVAAAQLSDQYISDRFLPDKAIDLIDEAGSHVRLRSGQVLKKARELEKELMQITKEKNEAVRREDFEKAKTLRDREIKVRAEMSAIQPKMSAAESDDNPVVTESDIQHIVSSWTGIPVEKVSRVESDHLLEMEETLHRRVVGQDEAVKVISRAIRRARVGLKNPNRPIASFIFSGPTGVGKTELAKALAGYYFESEEAMVRLDMSEYMERHAVSKLIGSPPGYVGYSEGGQLTEAVRSRPYTVVLFDEIEKAHPDVFNMMLQILEDGRLTDSKGRTVDFKNTLLIMTSNVGSNVIEKEGGRDCDDMDGNYKMIKSLVTDELKQYFKPEFLNRLDEIIVFRQLTKLEVKEIAEIMLKEVFVRLQKKGIEVQVTEIFREKILEEGYQPSYGARPLRRAIMRLLEDSMAEKMLSGEIKEGDSVIVDVHFDGNVMVLRNQRLGSPETRW